MTETPRPQNVEIKKKIKYMDTNFDIIFKIDENCDLEIICICENGICFISEKFNIKKSNLEFDLFSNLIKEEENLELEGDFNNNELTIKIFKIIKIKFNMAKTNENSEKIIQYLCNKVYDLTKEISKLKENNIDKNDLKIIPLTFSNGWKDYD